MKFDHQKFNDIATEIILSALYEYANPINLFAVTAAEINGRKEKAIHNYQNDPMTRARVENIVAILDRNIVYCLHLEAINICTCWRCSGFDKDPYAEDDK